jgi:monovalent cation:H+ antiporter-2, CPA2 family
MNTTLLIIFISLAIATVLNIFLKKLSISHIIGYIVTGVVVSNYFHFNGSQNLHALDTIAEFGVVFLMFTIGLEMSYSKIKEMNQVIFVNGFLQMAVTSIIIFCVAFFVFNQPTVSALLIALAFGLSSTAIVSTYLRKSKDINTPYGARSIAILIFQDIAVIPILLLIQFLSNDSLSLSEVLLKTFVSASIIIVSMFTVGKYVMNKLLSFASQARLEELFLGSILSIILGASLLANQLGFTYSLGAFISGMIPTLL